MLDLQSTCILGYNKKVMSNTCTIWNFSLISRAIFGLYGYSEEDIQCSEGIFRGGRYPGQVCSVNFLKRAFFGEYIKRGRYISQWKYYEGGDIHWRILWRGREISCRSSRGDRRQGPLGIHTHPLHHPLGDEDEDHYYGHHGEDDDDDTQDDSCNIDSIEWRWGWLSYLVLIGTYIHLDQKVKLQTTN